jgi:hypothetical protein
MDNLNNDPMAESSVAVAERGLAAWRAAKAAWLDSFAAFVAPEAEAAPSSEPPA